MEIRAVRSEGLFAMQAVLLKTAARSTGDMQ
jgi:hypothetical protein